MTPILIKVLLTMLLVSALSIIAERASPRLAGVLSGFPVGSAITLTFIGIEQGPVFAAESALHNLAGMPAMLCLLYAYAGISGRGSKISIVSAPLISTLIFLLAAVALRWMNLPTLVSLLLSTAGVLLAQWRLSAFPEQDIAKRVRLGWGALLFRAGVAAGVVLAVTSAASSVGPAWAGLFTSFPVTVFPLLIILQYTYGPAPGQAVIKNIPRGLWSLIAFTLTLSFLEPRVGVAWATSIALSASLATLLLTTNAHRFFPPSRKQPAPTHLPQA